MIVKLEEILLQKRDKATKCGFCNTEYNVGDIRSYDHTSGWIIEGFKETQWLYFHCHNCGYDWAIRH